VDKTSHGSGVQTRKEESEPPQHEPHETDCFITFHSLWLWSNLRKRRFVNRTLRCTVTNSKLWPWTELAEARGEPPPSAPPDLVQKVAKATKNCCSLVPLR
jgi:hypothetical protein